MTFVGLILRNISSRPLRAVLTGLAVAIGVMAVVALGILTSSLKETATQILKVGDADFTITQKHTDDIINGTISQDDIAAIGKVPGVERAVGALIGTDSYDADHPVIIEVGLAPEDQGPFGVDVLSGTTYSAVATDQVMLGYVLASSIHKKVGDHLTIGGHDYTVTGLYSTNVSFGNSTMMFPSPPSRGSTVSLVRSPSASSRWYRGRRSRPSASRSTTTSCSSPPSKPQRTTVGPIGTSPSSPLPTRAARSWPG